MSRAVMITLFSAVALAQGPASQRIPVIVELFTSEGCSSCPPADNLLLEMESRRIRLLDKQRFGGPGVEIITLGEHVDYWDDLNWKDSFSSPLFSARQEDYGRAFRVQAIYTPQVVINGQAQTSGTDLSAIET